MVYELVDTTKAAALFGGWSETLIWSCLQKVMGKIYVTGALAYCLYLSRIHSPDSKGGVLARTDA